MEIRQIFGRALQEAGEKMVADQGKNPVFAAPLAVRVLARLKNLLSDDDIRSIFARIGPLDKEKIKLTGNIFGPFLYPNLGPEEWSTLKFRDFLLAFPDVVKVHERESSGDMVQILTTSAEDRVELGNNYRSLLLRTLKEQLARSVGGVAGVGAVTPLIPINQLAIWMNRADTAFNVARLGYSSFLEWLQKVPEVKISDEDGVIRVGEVHASNSPGSTETGPITRTAYLLVDGCDLISTVHEILGSKPIQSQLPDWGKVLQFCRDKWPNMDWRGRYFIAQTPDEHHSMEGFTHYLEAVGFKVRSLNFDDNGYTFEESRSARNQVSQRGLEKGLQIISSEATPSVLLVASHSAVLKPLLEELLHKRGAQCQVGVLGFPEKMPRHLTALKRERLLIFDLESDCRAFKKPLKRSFGIDVEDIKAEDVL
jgi:hypothetical protein